MNGNRPALVTAWGITLLASALPGILLRGSFEVRLPWLTWAQIGLLAAALIASLAWKALAGLRPYLATLLVVGLAGWFFQDVLVEFSAWQRYFGKAFYAVRMFDDQLRGLGVALAVLIWMLFLKRRWRAFYLVRGDLRAAAAPIPVLMDQASTWSRLGWILAACIGAWTLAVLLVEGQTPPETLLLALPLLPIVVVLAAMYAFSQEMVYRAGLLTTATEAVGARQALLLTAVFFGAAQYYAVPSGLLGALTAGLLGWLLGRSMLETKGFLWPWFLHFLQGIIIFRFMAMSLAVPGL
jgi:hypothetical protein